MSQILRVDHLTKKFPPSFTAVNDISFSLEQGEILGLLGPNGAGKTTTIQMLLGTLSISSGSISYFGKNLNTHRSEILDHVGFATTYVGLPRELSIAENLDIFARIYGLSSNERKLRIELMLKTFELEDLKNKSAGELSTGQLTRVMLAKAFVHNPRVVILDEPTASLDPDISASIRTFIISMQKECGTSILFTSHNMEEVSEVCDRVIVLKAGTIIANDAPENLAAAVSKAKVHLVISQGFDELRKYTQEHNIACTITDRSVVFEIEEADISQLLAQLARNGIHYTYISVEKPTLEDYFLQIAKK